MVHSISSIDGSFNQVDRWSFNQLDMVIQSSKKKAVDTVHVLFFNVMLYVLLCTYHNK